MDKFIAFLILVLLVIGAIVIITGDMSLADGFLWLFSNHG